MDFKQKWTPSYIADPMVLSVRLYGSRFGKKFQGK